MEDLRQRVKELEVQVASLLELVAVLQVENRELRLRLAHRTLIVPALTGARVL